MRRGTLAIAAEVPYVEVPKVGRNNRHVVQADDGRWAVRGENADRASGVFNTQRQAEERAHELLRNTGGGELITHGTDGRIRDSRTVPPGNDPFPPRDKV